MARQLTGLTGFSCVADPTDGFVVVLPFMAFKRIHCSLILSQCSDI